MWPFCGRILKRGRPRPGGEWPGRNSHCLFFLLSMDYPVLLPTWPAFLPLFVSIHKYLINESIFKASHNKLISIDSGGGGGGTKLKVKSVSKDEWVFKARNRIALLMQTQDIVIACFLIATGKYQSSSSWAVQVNRMQIGMRFLRTITGIWMCSKLWQFEQFIDLI